MTKRRLEVRLDKLPLVEPFRIAGRVFHDADSIVVELQERELRGRGEAAGVYYLGDDIIHMTEQLETSREAIERCESREELRSLLPAGGARNAVDCAMWELEAQRAGVPAWSLAGMGEPRPLVTTFTVGAGEPEIMADRAQSYSGARAIKIKLTGELDLDIERVRAVRAARTEVWLGVDANQGFTIDQLDRFVEAAVEQRVSLIEQPLARGHEADLNGFKSPIRLAADESALTLDDVAGLVGRFDVVNIKLDKCGGLTEALMIADTARQMGLTVMVGNMIGSSLAMAPAFIVGQLCEIVDLDGPVFLTKDSEPGVEYKDGRIHCSDRVWGSRAAA